MFVHVRGLKGTSCLAGTDAAFSGAAGERLLAAAGGLAACRGRAVHRGRAHHQNRARALARSLHGPSYAARAQPQVMQSRVLLLTMLVLVSFVLDMVFIGCSIVADNAPELQRVFPGRDSCLCATYMTARGCRGPLTRCPWSMDTGAVHALFDSHSVRWLPGS